MKTKSLPYITALLTAVLLILTPNARAGNPSPWEKGQPGGRAITIDTASGLQFAQKEIHVKAGEALALTLHNPDTMQHNWVLLKPGTTDAVGKLANDLASDPANIQRNYIPDSTDILFYTRVVDPTKSTTIYFTAPADKGSYPYICTFPGHWTIMRGVMIVE
jgi:azurin